MNRLNFWLIWLFGAGPMLLAMLLYFNGFSPSATSQRGALLQPGQTLSDWKLIDRKGDAWQANGKWQLLLTSDTACTGRCAYWQTQLPQVNQALGKDRDRVLWTLVSSARSTSKSTVQLSSEQLPPLGDAMWLADPFGNLVLHYSLEQSPKDLLKDLKRLLKVSRIG
jgi:cytochrome oxidase Cu insertion factor (SCO1/SenC/PrrC family)